MIGRTDWLDKERAIEHWKAQGLDFTRLFYKPEMPDSVAIHNSEKQNHPIAHVLDRKLIECAKPALEAARPVKLELPIASSDRSTGAMLSGRVAKAYGHAGLPEDTIWIGLKGTAGQSFGAWLARGVTLDLAGEANDYVGKGLSGGKIIVRPPDRTAIVPEESIIVGNTVLYGAISGECYFRGVAGERFAVRNSGAIAVVEGTGDHGCEYMTGGCVVVLGPTGRNFAAGMSGGVAYVLDERGDFERHCNMAMVELEPHRSRRRFALRSGERRYAGALQFRQSPSRHDEGRRVAAVPAHRKPPPLHRLRAREGDPRQLEGLPSEIREGDADRVPQGAREHEAPSGCAASAGARGHRDRREWPVIEIRRAQCDARPRGSRRIIQGLGMGKITGFLEIEREDRDYAPVSERTRHFREFVLPPSEEDVRKQAARCMDCGIPYCHRGCPVNNQIPDWNDLVYHGEWHDGCAQPAFHQQLPGGDGPDLPGSLRGILHAQHRRCAGHDQKHRMRHRRPGLRSGLDRSRAA